MTRLRSLMPLALVLVAGSLVAGGQAPPAPQAGRGAARPPAVVSPELQTDRRVTFRIYAPNASSVFLNAGDLPPVTFTPPGATLCLGSEGAPTASESGSYVNSRAAGERRPL